MSKIIVLGAGMVGNAIAIDLSKKHQLTLSDISLDRLNQVKNKCENLEITPVDVTNPSELQKNH